MDKETVLSILRREKLITGSLPEFKPLKGGVSSEIFLITDGENRCVVKQALPKLNVEDDWFADISRNENEQEFLQFLRRFRPESVPKLLYSDQEHHFFVMEYLDMEFINWKKEMLKGVFNSDTAKNAAELLADIHLKSWENEENKRNFNKTENFYSLRTEPYFVTTGKRHPDLKEIFFEEVERLKNYQQAIVHGDFSPKNIMVKEDRVVLLDHEVACFGDPAFDVAFFLNHLYLKMLHNYQKYGEVQDLTDVTWKCYFDKMGARILKEMEPRVNRLLLMMMLARIDGKSPVEYLGDNEQEFVRSFVKEHLADGSFSQSDINRKWKEQLNKVNFR